MQHVDYKIDEWFYEIGSPEGITELSQMFGRRKEIYTMSLVSIIIPVHNEDYILPRCMDSVLAQTHRELEIILVDDGSSDTSPALCDAYATRDSRVRVIHQKNAGTPTARNVALEITTGEYVQFVDADDYILPGMTAGLVTAMQKNPADMIVCGFNWITSEENMPDVVRTGRELPTGMMTAREFIELFALDYDMSTPCALWNKLFRRELIERDNLRFRLELSNGQDLAFIVEHVRNLRSIYSIPERYYQYIYGVTGRGITVRDRYRPLYLKQRFIAMRLLHETAAALGVNAKMLCRLNAMLANQIIGSIVSHCRHDATIPKAKIMENLKWLAEQPEMGEWLKDCRPERGQSRLLPLLLRLHWLRPLYYLARHRANVRFGRFYGNY